MLGLADWPPHLFESELRDLGFDQGHVELPALVPKDAADVIDVLGAAAFLEKLKLANDDVLGGATSIATSPIASLRRSCSRGSP